MSIFIPHAEYQMNKYSKESGQRKTQKQTTSLKKGRERGLTTLAVKIYLCLHSVILNANPLVQFPIP